MACWWCRLLVLVLALFLLLPALFSPSFKTLGRTTVVTGLHVGLSFSQDATEMDMACVSAVLQKLTDITPISTFSLAARIIILAWNG